MYVEGSVITSFIAAMRNLYGVRLRVEIGVGTMTVYNADTNAIITEQAISEA